MLDTIDQQIIQLLQFNGKVTIKEISKLTLTLSTLKKVNSFNNRTS